MTDQPMTDTIRFEDGAAYERYMGLWSRRVGHAMLDWLAPPPGLRWLDVGCGNGAFTELLVQRCAPAAVDGVDPSEAQLAFARARPLTSVARFQPGDAMALPFEDDAFDMAVLPLVISFVPDPARGVAEAARVVRESGVVAAYMWDAAGGGMPYAALQAEIRALGMAVPHPPSPGASDMAALGGLWADAGLLAVESRIIDVERTFADFDDYWTTVRGGPSVGPTLAAMAPDALAALQTRLRTVLPVDDAGRLTLRGRANAVKGVVASRSRSIRASTPTAGSGR